VFSEGSSAAVVSGHLTCFDITSVPSRVILHGIAPCICISVCSKPMDLNLSHVAVVKCSTLCSFFEGIWRRSDYCQVKPHIHLQIHKCGNENSSCLGRLATTSYTTRITVIRLGLLFLFHFHNYHRTKVVRCIIRSGTAFWCGAVVYHPSVATPPEGWKA
jgi:hypothetical protein